MSQAESDWKKLKEWSTMYRDYLYQHTPFRTFMRSRDSTEEEKFESIDSLISQLFLVDNFKDFNKVYYSLKQDKRVKSPSDTGLYCKSKAFTEAWASEITSTLDGGVNRPCGQLISTVHCKR